MLNGDGTSILGDFWFIFRSFICLYAVGFYKMISQCWTGHKLPTGMPDKLHGRVAMVTGGGEGIGRSVSERFARLGIHTVIACLDTQKGKIAAEEIMQKYPDVKVEVLELNLASFDSIRRCVKSFQNLNLPLHILVNNAGVMVTPYGETEEGFEMQLGVNLIGHFLLSRLLLPALAQAGTESHCSRIINTASVVNCVGDVNNIFADYPYSPHAAYADSKSAIIMMSYWLQQLLQHCHANVTVNSIHPGVVGSGIFRHVIYILRKPQELMVPMFFKTYEQAADTTAYAALSRDLEGQGGLYIDNCEPTSSSPQTYDYGLQAKLWKACCKWTKMSTSLQIAPN